MKRILSLLLVAVFCLAAAACSKPSVTPPEEPGSSETATEPSWDTTTDTEITANTGMEESAISSDTSATTVPTTRASDRDYDGGGGQEYDVLDRRDLPSLGDDGSYRDTQALLCACGRGSSRTAIRDRYSVQHSCGYQQPCPDQPVEEHQPYSVLRQQRGCSGAHSDAVSVLQKHDRRLRHHLSGRWLRFHCLRIRRSRYCQILHGPGDFRLRAKVSCRALRLPCCAVGRDEGDSVCPVLCRGLRR